MTLKGVLMAPKPSKRYVEQCWAIEVKDFMAAPNSYGHITWNDLLTGGEIAGVDYCLAMFGDDQALLMLQYELDENVVTQDIALQPTYPNYGGVRWWFTCPFRSGQGGCGRRVGKLYLPRIESYFGCRACHLLSYRSTRKWAQMSCADWAR